MRHASTILLGAAGLSWTLGQAVLPDAGLEYAERYDAVAAARGLEATSAALFVMAGALLVLGALSLARRRVDSKLVSVGTVLTALGGLWLVGGRGVFNLTFYRLTDHEVPRESAMAFLGSSTGIGFVPLLLMLPALLLGPVLLAIGLRRTRRAGWAPLVCWVVGIGTFLATEFTLKPGEIAGVGIAAVGLALIGWAVDNGVSHLEEPADQRAPALSR